MKTFTVNGKNYKSKPYDFDTACTLEDMGVQIEDIERKKISFLRAYFSLCAGIGLKEAGSEINKHIVSGESLEELSAALSHELNESDFFRALIEAAKKTAEETESNQVEAEASTSR